MRVRGKVDRPPRLPHPAEKALAVPTTLLSKNAVVQAYDECELVNYVVPLGGELFYHARDDCSSQAPFESSINGVGIRSWGESSHQ